MRRLKISYLCQFPGYENDFIFRLIKILCGDQVECVRPKHCDLLLVGPFLHKRFGLKMKFRTAYKFEMAGRRSRPMVLYQTGENTRWNSIDSDYSLSFDLGVNDPRHIRFPLWMAIFDWKHEGVQAHGEGRFGPPVPIEQLMRPLGPQADRMAKAILISSHQREPRATLLNAVKKVMEVDCYGSAFQPKERPNFLKTAVCRDKQFSLCPENSMSPGYYTEKIPEAFAAGCIPITWCDGNVCCDFNPKAMINMAHFASTGYAEGLREAIQPLSLEQIRSEPLLLKRPTLDGIKEYLLKILAELK